MAWFFTDEAIASDKYTITGEDAQHIKKSLRMKIGEELTLVTPQGTEHLCKIHNLDNEGVTVKVLSSSPTMQEPRTKVVLYQALTKGDKMDFIVQKCVELGVHRIVPVITDRCISRPDEKSMKKKVQRWQKIALGAAQQSRRGMVPLISDIMSLEEGGNEAVKSGTAIVFYEAGGESLRTLISEDEEYVSIFVGSEGGFEEKEIQYLSALGVRVATLGKRILRAETAPIAGISSIMLHTGNLE